MRREPSEAVSDAVPFDVPGGWTRRSVPLSGRVFDILLPAQPDCVLECAAEAEQRAAPDSATDPYWATLWSSALPTAEMVLESEWRGDETVLELGCGMGLVGLAALARGLSVTFSDHVPQACQLAVENARRHGWKQAQAVTLDWRQPVRPATQPPYDVILASDILYHRGNHFPILQTLDQWLAPQGVCWIGDPGRYDSREFLAAACQRFRVRLRDRQGDYFAAPQSGHYQLFELQR